VPSPDELEPGLDALGALGDPTRRAVYEAVASAGPQPVSRDEVADTLGVGRTLAAFHLDKLVDAGLLEASYARRTGRSGPGAGRTAKLYRRTEAEHTATIPPRAYRGAAEILAEAIDRAGADSALYAVARERGRAQAVAGEDVMAALTARGYEPVAGESAILLRNCPFHRLAEEFPPLVCGMNLALVQGLLDGAGHSGWRATTDPEPGYCCVKLSKTNGG
jgi:predicted ArsR family transcriptional regulator